jgi:prepilin-type N-terminal cleavage/methylation domain-containing protein
MMCRGFSLVELLIVMIVAGVMAAVAVPQATRWIENYRVKGAARQLVTDFQSARMKTISERVSHRLSFDNAGKSYAIQKWNSTTSQWDQVGTNRALASETNPYFARVAGIADTFTNHVAVFSTSGSVSSGGKVTLSGVHCSKNVTVSLIGRVSIE